MQSSLKQFVHAKQNVTPREFMLMTRFVHDLTVAKQVRNYHLLVYQSGSRCRRVRYYH